MTESTSWCKDDEALARHTQKTRKRALEDALDAVKKDPASAERAVAMLIGYDELTPAGPMNTDGAEELACDFDHPHPSHPCGRHVSEASTPCTCDKEYPCPACLARANDVLDAQRARHVGDDPKPEYIAVPALENARQKLLTGAEGGQVAVLTPAECREVGLRLTR